MPSSSEDVGQQCLRSTTVASAGRVESVGREHLVGLGDEEGACYLVEGDGAGACCGDDFALGLGKLA